MLEQDDKPYGPLCILKGLIDDDPVRNGHYAPANVKFTFSVEISEINKEKFTY